MWNRKLGEKREQSERRSAEAYFTAQVPALRGRRLSTKGLDRADGNLEAFPKGFWYGAAILSTAVGGETQRITTHTAQIQLALLICCVPCRSQPPSAETR